MSTPGVINAGADESPLVAQDVVLYRAIAARANYLAQGRTDICFVAKELCRHMSNPRKCDWDNLKDWAGIC